jgi:hypothetical protein
MRVGEARAERRTRRSNHSGRGGLRGLVLQCFAATEKANDLPNCKGEKRLVDEEKKGKRKKTNGVEPMLGEPIHLEHVELRVASLRFVAIDARVDCGRDAKVFQNETVDELQEKKRKPSQYDADGRGEEGEKERERERAHRGKDWKWRSVQNCFRCRRSRVPRRLRLARPDEKARERGDVRPGALAIPLLCVGSEQIIAEVDEGVLQLDGVEESGRLGIAGGGAEGVRDSLADGFGEAVQGGRGGDGGWLRVEESQKLGEIEEAE